MKIRKGFVSNSSSSSFVCDICGENEAGSDSVGIEEFGFFECVEGHTVCLDHLSSEKREELSDLIYNSEDNDEYVSYYEVPEKYCPICQMKEFSQSELIKYFLKVSNKTKDDIKKDVVNNFKDYKEFKDFLDKK